MSPVPPLLVQPSALIDHGLMSEILEMAVPERSLRVQTTLKYGRGSWQVLSCVYAKGVADFVRIMVVHNAKNK